MKYITLFQILFNFGGIFSSVIKLSSLPMFPLGAVILPKKYLSEGTPKEMTIIRRSSSLSAYPHKTALKQNNADEKTIDSNQESLIPSQIYEDPTNIPAFLENKAVTALSTFDTSSPFTTDQPTANLMKCENSELATKVNLSSPIVYTISKVQKNSASPHLSPENLQIRNFASTLLNSENSNFLRNLTENQDPEANSTSTLFLRRDTMSSMISNISASYPLTTRKSPLSSIGKSSTTLPVIGNTSIRKISNYLQTKEINTSTQKLPQNTVNVKMLKNISLPLVVIGGKTYHLETSFKANFHEAAHFCRRHEMDLLSIGTQTEEDFLTDFLFKSKVSEVWTSGTDLAEEGKFVWLSTGQPFNFTAWGPNQPDNDGSIEDCVQVILRPLQSENYAWEDSLCDVPSYFICEERVCSDHCITNTLE